MKASKRMFVVLVMCAMAGVTALGCGGLNGGAKGIQVAAGHAQDMNGRSGPHTITASAEPGGSISPSGSTVVPRGSSQIFIATADTGYRVADVLVDGSSVGALSDLYHDNSSSYTFDNVAANHVISASFWRE